MVAEEVKLLRNLVARRFFLRAACSHSLMTNQSSWSQEREVKDLPVKVVCLGLLTVVLLVEFWQPCTVHPRLETFDLLKVFSPAS